MIYYIEIKKNKDIYQVSIFRNRIKLREFAPPLHPSAQVELKDVKYSLGDVVRALSESDLDSKINDVLDERGQHELGIYLFDVTLGQLRENDKADFAYDGENTEIRIITQDEFIARLPWVLLTFKDIPLSLKRYAISITHDRLEHKACLSPIPSLLIVMPNPNTHPFEDTFSQSHYEDIEKHLNPVYGGFKHKKLKFVTTYEAFERTVKEFEPQVIYYYGHGEGNRHSSGLVFCDINNNPEIKPISDITVLLNQLEKPPVFVYLNCCYGDSGGLLGCGLQLRSKVPAILTNRTIAHIEIAQKQAELILKDVLVNGKEPHKAATAMYSNLSVTGGTTGDIRWMTPVIHCNYTDWAHKPSVRKENPWKYDSFWDVKLDRVKQFGTLHSQTIMMLKYKKPRGLAFLWYGAENSGLQIFHERLKVELPVFLNNYYIKEIKPAWPFEFADPARSYSDMLSQAFSVHNFDDIPDEIRSWTKGKEGIQSLIIIRHQTIIDKTITPARIEDYLSWWNRYFALRQESSHFFIICFSFLVDSPTKYQKYIDEKTTFKEIDLENLLFWLLDEMGDVDKQDLKRFLRTHNISIPTGGHSIDAILDAIIRESGGEFEATLDLLKRVVENGISELKVTIIKKSEKDEEEPDY